MVDNVISNIDRDLLEISIIFSDGFRGDNAKKENGGSFLRKSNVYKFSLHAKMNGIVNSTLVCNQCWFSIQFSVQFGAKLWQMN